MTLNGKEGEYISLGEGATLTANFRQTHHNGIQSHLFGYEKLQGLMAQPGAMALRIYYGKDADNNRALVIVATDASGNDILDASAPMILDRAVACPPNCSSDNPLNS